MENKSQFKHGFCGQRDGQPCICNRLVRLEIGNKRSQLMLKLQELPDDSGREQGQHDGVQQQELEQSDGVQQHERQQEQSDVEQKHGRQQEQSGVEQKHGRQQEQSDGAQQELSNVELERELELSNVELEREQGQRNVELEQEQEQERSNVQHEQGLVLLEECNYAQELMEQQSFGLVRPRQVVGNHIPIRIHQRKRWQPKQEQLRKISKRKK